MLAAVLLALAPLVFQPVLPDTSAQSSLVYVQDPAAQPARGEDGPLHDAALREPTLADPPTAQLYAGDGHPLPVLLEGWRTAAGTADVGYGPDGTTHVRAQFHQLVPSGRYSLFVRQVAGRRVVLTPLDLVGVSNSFSASPSGDGSIVTTYPGLLPHGAQIALLYHSDRVDHGSSAGDPYRNVHVQLILRIP